MHKPVFIFCIVTLISIAGCDGINHEKISLTQDHAGKNAVTSTPAISESSSSTLNCNDALWKHVYDPDRLQVLDKCKTITGVIEESNADPDGDQHMLLKLDKGQKDLLKKENKKKKKGDLVIEVVCVNNITRKRAMGACTGYANNISLPSIGEHVSVTGSYVIDSHNGWTEIHPVSRIEKIK
jgi:hypothetical protein